MANELKSKGTVSAGTMSAILIRSSDGYLWDTNAAAYAAAPTAANAAVTLTEAGATGHFIGSLPALALSGAAGGQIKAEYYDVVPASLAFTSAIVERETFDVDASGTVLLQGANTLIDQQPVPDSRTAIIITKAGVGNIGERSLTLTIGEIQAIAADFRKLMPTNGRITSATFTQITQPVGGSLSIGTAGQDKAQAKVSLTPDTAGTYTFECVATFADGGGQAAAVVTVVVV